MKRSVIAITALLMVCSSLSIRAQDGSKKKKDKSSPEAMSSDLPYTINYSSNFTTGKREQAKMVLGLYKGFEAADWSKDTWFADTVMAILPDGSVTRGKAEVLDGLKAFRESLSSVKFSFDAVIPLRSVDHMDDWVAVWGQETDTKSDGTVTDTDFQTIWKIDNGGKIAFMRILNGKSPGMAQ